MIPDVQDGTISEPQQAMASVFANPDDLRRYQEAIANGATEKEALSVGDQGKGAWGDDTTSTTDPQVAVKGAPHNALIQVTGPKGTVIARNTDKINSDRIDLNPATALAVGHPGGVIPVQWSFVNGTAPSVPNTNLGSSAPISLMPSRGAASAIPEINLLGMANEDLSQGQPLMADENAPSAGVMSTDSMTGEPLVPASSVDQSDASGTDAQDAAGVLHTNKILQTMQPPPPGTPGVVYNPDHSVSWPGPGGTTLNRSDDGVVTYTQPAAQKQQHPVMVGGLPYQMKDGKLEPMEVGGVTDSGATAADPFKGLSDSEAAEAKAIMERRSPVTARQLSSPNPQVKKLLDRVYLADPNFNVANYDIDKATMKDYSPAGKDGQNILSLNQTINHLGHLEETSKEVGGGSISLINRPFQELERLFGTKKAESLRGYSTTQTALDSELGRLLKGGVATQQEVNEWRDQLDVTQAPNVRERAYKDVISILGGRLDALKGNYERQLNRPLGGAVLPEAQKVLQRHGWNLDKSPDAPASPTPSPTPDPNEKKVLGVPMSQARAAYQQAQAVLGSKDATPEQQRKAQQVIDRLGSSLQGM